jgi:hypothetical protein
MADHKAILGRHSQSPSRAVKYFLAGSDAKSFLFSSVGFLHFKTAREEYAPTNFAKFKQ